MLEEQLQAYGQGDYFEELIPLLREYTRLGIDILIVISYIRTRKCSTSVLCTFRWCEAVTCFTFHNNRSTIAAACGDMRKAFCVYRSAIEIPQAKLSVEMSNTSKKVDVPLHFGPSSSASTSGYCCL